MALRPQSRPGVRAARPKSTLSPAMSVVGNIAMFIIAAVICFGLMRGFRGLVANAGEPAGYMLVTSRPVQAGEQLSKDNAEWKAIKGKRPTGFVVAPDKRAPIDGYVSMIRLASNKPVKLSLVAKEQVTAVRATGSLTGFVLSQEDLAALAPFLKAGDRVDIIAIRGAGKTSDEVGADLSVATVVSSAEVTGLIKPMSVGRAARQGAAVIAVSSEQARMLGLLRQVAKLEVVLSPSRPRESQGVVFPFIPWESAGELGLTSNAAEGADARVDVASQGGTQLGPVVPSKPQYTVAVITPSGTTQANVPN